jgi:hypothetical protein
MLSGNLASIGVGGIVAYVTSLIWPENYDFAPTRAMNAPPGSRFLRDYHSDSPSVDETHEKKGSATDDVHSVSSGPTTVPDESDLDPAGLDRAFRFAAWASVVLVRHPLFSPASVPGFHFDTTALTIICLHSHSSFSLSCSSSLSHSRFSLHARCTA